MCGKNPFDPDAPGKGFDRNPETSQPQLAINLHLIKRGSLKFDL